MRKLTLALFVCLLLTNISFSQSNNYNWITPNKTYLKLFINDDGMYRINKVDFENAGVSTGGLDPRTVKVLYKGSQLPIFFQGEDDGTFDNSDYFDFYGKRNYGGPTPHRDGFSNAVVLRHTFSAPAWIIARASSIDRIPPPTPKGIRL